MYLYCHLEPEFRVSQLHARVDSDNTTCVPILVGSGSGWLKRSLNGKRIEGKVVIDNHWCARVGVGSGIV